MVENKLFEAKNDGERVKILEEFLTQRLVQGDRTDKLISQTVNQIAKTKGNIAIDTLAEQFGYSPRQLERKFLAVMGITPKFYSRIARFKTVFDQVTPTPGRQDWSSIAMTCGYYDQSHFIKNFKFFTGLTPTQFFAQRRYIAEMLTASNTLSDFYNTNVLK